MKFQSLRASRKRPAAVASLNNYQSERQSNYYPVARHCVTGAPGSPGSELRYNEGSLWIPNLTKITAPNAEMLYALWENKDSCAT